jgi:hypothetical protein
MGEHLKSDLDIAEERRRGIFPYRLTPRELLMRVHAVAYRAGIDAPDENGREVCLRWLNDHWDRAEELLRAMRLGFLS